MHKAALAVHVALFIERFSRLVQPRPPQTPIARLQFNYAKIGLSLEQRLFATQPPKVVILREDTYFHEVEQLLLESTEQQDSA
ncbi:MAG: hypothetical protein ACK41E_00240 [Deinococcales bacterium]